MIPRKPRVNTNLNCRLTAAQNAASDAQSKKALQDNLKGQIARAMPVFKNGLPVWTGVLGRGK